MPTASRLGGTALAVAALLAITVCGGASASAEPAPQVPSPERALATVHPALVRVTGTFGGWVHDRQGVYANDGRAYALTLTCSGFGVHSDGYLATAGHCVDANDPTVRMSFIEAAAEEAVAGRTDTTLEQMIEFGRSAWDIEGRAAGSPIESEIRVSGIAGAPPDGLLARVVDDRPIGQGDVALLKVDTTNLPTAELVTGSGLVVGTPLLAASYPESAGERVGPEAQPSIAHGAVTGSMTDGGRPIHETSAAMEAGSSGGPAVDDNGRVLGINSARTRGSEAFNFVVPISGFTDLLGRNGVSAELGPRDLRYREALDDYYAGEHSDAIEAIDRLQQDGPVHPRIAKLRADAEAAREQVGDASENRLVQVLIWVGVAAGVVLVAVSALLIVRRRRRRAPVIATMAPHPPFPGPQPGAAWPRGPFPPPGQHPAPPHRPFVPGPHRPGSGPRAPIGTPGRPGQAPPAAGQPFVGPTRPINVRPATPPPAPADRADAPERATTRITLRTTPSAPAAPRAGPPSADGSAGADPAEPSARPADAEPRVPAADPPGARTAPPAEAADEAEGKERTDA